MTWTSKYCMWFLASSVVQCAPLMVSFRAQRQPVDEALVDMITVGSPWLMTLYLASRCVFHQTHSLQALCDATIKA